MIKAIFLAVAILVGTGLAAAAADRDIAYDFSFTAIDGGRLPLASYRGKALLVVNTASFCGFTRQYAELQALWSRYRDRGLVVLGVPSNDFGSQEPGSEAEIKQFCEVNFAVDFPLTAKEHVVGANAHPFYKWSQEKLGPESAPHWNFHKILVAPNGAAVRFFPTMTSPLSDAIIGAIEPLLEKPEG